MLKIKIKSQTPKLVQFVTKVAVNAQPQVQVHAQNVQEQYFYNHRHVLHHVHKDFVKIYFNFFLNI